MSTISKLMDDYLLRADNLRCRIDASWDESKHPRAEDGKFGEGSGSSGSGDNKDVETPKGYEPNGKADLKAQGFTPMRRTGKGPTMTEVARVAWATAEQLGKPQKILPTHLGWQMVKKNESVPYGHPYMVVTPEGKVHNFKAKLNKD